MNPDWTLNRDGTATYKGTTYPSLFAMLAAKRTEENQDSGVSTQAAIVAQRRKATSKARRPR